MRALYISISIRVLQIEENPRFLGSHIIAPYCMWVNYFWFLLKFRKSYKPPLSANDIVGAV